MDRVINLLAEKNHYLEKFYSLNETELVNFAQQDFDNLASFYNKREKILEIIQYIDGEIDKASANATTEMTDADRVEINDALRIKEQYVARILEQDLQVLSCIELAKNNIIKELQDLSKGKKAVRGYKMPTFTNSLDEEI